MNIASPIFECSAPDLESCPDETLPEFAFIGRSNVGKSSLLNMLTGKRDLARVSPTPGFTKLINFFVIDQQWRLVDLPGYGYSRVARKDSARFNDAVTVYLRRRPNLCCVFALIDSGLPPQKIDLEFLEEMIRHAVPFALVFTKIDRISSIQAQANIAAFTERISAWFEMLPEIFTCSAITSQGRTDLLAMIKRSLGDLRTQTEEASKNDVTSSLGITSPAPTRKEKAKKTRMKRPNPARPW